MSLRQFLNVAYAILVEEYQRMGVDLLSALEKTSEWAEGASDSPVPGASPVPRVSARQNDAAMAALKAQMSGVKGSPI